MEKLVLIPGYMCNKKMWHNQLKLLRENYKLIIPNLKQGESINEFSQNVIKLTHDPFSIMGFSMGGFVALDLAINYPQKVQ